MTTLYTFHLSVWCAAAELAVYVPRAHATCPSYLAKQPIRTSGELGLTDKITKKSIDVVNAENLSPDYFKINPSATVPALSAEGTVYTNTTDVVDYLVKIAPVKVAPRTEFTKVAHDDAHEPNFLFVGVVRL
ncbi:hypothetical protein OF83DRAFT_364105 [Amylostereum chailletii]|nr:hypothetical protein OF83DRAFT_364105 [Amylostereum chailletii]